MHDGSFGSLLSGVFIAEVSGIAADGRPEVTLPDGSVAPASTLVDVRRSDTGRKAAVVPAGDGTELVLLGLIRSPLPVAEIDGERLVLEGRREVVLRCGKASMTLTADGRVTIRGTQVLSRADGANRVQGSSVQLN